MVITIIATFAAIWMFGSIIAISWWLFDTESTNEELIAAVFWPIVLLMFVCFWVWDVSEDAFKHGPGDDL